MAQIINEAPFAGTGLEIARAQKAVQTILNMITLEELELLATADKEKLNIALGALRMQRGFSKLSSLIK